MFICAKCHEVFGPKVPSCCQVLLQGGTETRCIDCYDASIQKQIGNKQSAIMKKRFFADKITQVKSKWATQERKGKW